MAFGRAVRTMPGSAVGAGVSERVSFIRKTYAHLAGAIIAFIALEWAIMQLPIAREITARLLGNRFAWLMALGAFMLVGFIADRWARSVESVGLQYFGLGLYVLAEVVIFVPLIYIAKTYYPTAIPTAGLITVLLFIGLTLTVFITKKDFSFMRGALSLMMFGAIGIIIGGIVFGFTLGLWFSVLLAGLAGGYTLYYTSNVLHYYRTDQHVAASLALFSAIALMFWYILQIVMSLMGRD